MELQLATVEEREREREQEYGSSRRPRHAALLELEQPSHHATMIKLEASVLDLATVHPPSWTSLLHR
jgi:hypothetical protein